jgi:hypothetical protein
MKQQTLHRMLWLVLPFAYLVLRNRPLESIANFLLIQTAIALSILTEPYMLALWLLATLHARSARPFSLR